MIGLSLSTVFLTVSLSPFLRVVFPHPGPQPAVSRSSSIWFVRPFPSKVSKTRVLQGLSSDIPGYSLSPVTKFQVKHSSLPFGKVGLFTTPSHVSSPQLLSALNQNTHCWSQFHIDSFLLGTQTPGPGTNLKSLKCFEFELS